MTRGGLCVGVSCLCRGIRVMHSFMAVTLAPLIQSCEKLKPRFYLTAPFTLVSALVHLRA